LIPAGTGLPSYNAIEIKSEGSVEQEELEKTGLAESQPVAGD
jgi:hypothetical protein